ncbi:conserved hypothetical protein; putative signal peptide [Bradyrhizobium sp. ORS 285]|uniref:hypothetical protein n=1 Tax=Bradyrhizobium sp. ORS 285 TaxID=115808 RepID=UPI0002406D69|nr:hypothetical protein [Bradyrhizobium sp. ORS 285]CCD87238.1 conserved exported hypothetical protein [Bradyrhizobium sp. ORS 285]SMX58132.1 conserved hypothetical protein; putative signal peptide [Bradyrhizobium sp. ORS 285]
MSKLASSAIALIVAAAALAPVTSEARGHHRHHRQHHHHGLPYAISFLHNYGPGPLPGTFGFYDGPSTNHCYQSAAAYIGQDRRRHPCF